MHNAIVKFRKNRDIRNHFAENRANNKDNAPDAAGSPFGSGRDRLYPSRSARP